MEANEAKRILCEMRNHFNDESHTIAIWTAIRAIDTCISNGFEVKG